MMENGPWVLSAVMNSDINYRIVRLPVDNKNVSVAGGENIGVLKGKNIKGALELIEFYNQDEIMLKICKQSNALPPKMTLAKNLIETNPEYTIFAEQMETCISRSSYKFWPVITKSLSEGLFEVITGDSLPEDVVKSIQAQMRK